MGDRGKQTEFSAHSGHRQRLRERFANEGLDGFADHEVLELILFNALPRRNTNPIAHDLLRRFGSLSAVLEASHQDLVVVPGMGETASIFLGLIPALTRRYLNDRNQRLKPALHQPDLAAEVLIPLMAGRTEEVFYVLCLDKRCRLLYPALVSQGTVGETIVHPRRVVEVALRHKASKVMLTHNHPSGSLHPSRHDLALTRALQAALHPIGIEVVDHIIVAGNRITSLARDGWFAEAPKLDQLIPGLNRELFAEPDGSGTAQNIMEEERRYDPGDQ
ncbi:MAG: DNA repair protein RadC [Magnetococcales bacterium]|nr:DNA repair protein RadC [Magnetococcales bacterium]MBF0156804.1 DNA repair protein RadC [Magnetococcales bacterium]